MTITDKLSPLPLLNALWTMQSAKEDDDGQKDESIDDLTCPPLKISQASWLLLLSNMPSDPITTYQSSVDKCLQPVTSGSAITPYLEIPKENKIRTNALCLLPCVHRI